MQTLEDLRRAATRCETPCGEGRMVWHHWNAAAGRPLVLLHGGSGSWRHWVRQVPRFAATRAVLAADLPGLGESDDPPPPGDPPTIGAIVAEGLRRLLPDTAEADLVGFSFGAIIAGQAAARLGPALRSLTIVGAGALGVPRGEMTLARVRDREGEARRDAHRRNLATLMIADPARIDEQALAIQEWNTVHARTRSRGYAATPMLRDLLARIPVPVGAIWGSADQAAAPHLDRRVAALREARPDVAIELIEGAGHWVQYEAPEAFDAALSRLLARAV